MKEWVPLQWQMNLGDQWDFQNPERESGYLFRLKRTLIQLNFQRLYWFWEIWLDGSNITCIIFLPYLVIIVKHRYGVITVLYLHSLTWDMCISVYPFHITGKNIKYPKWIKLGFYFFLLDFHWNPNLVKMQNIQFWFTSWIFLKPKLENNRNHNQKRDNPNSQYYVH